MSFWRHHAAPTLHNALGTIIGTLALALISLIVIALVKPLRDLANAPTPLWVTAAAMLVVSCAFIIRIKMLCKELSTVKDKLAAAEANLTDAQKKQQARDAAQKARDAKQRLPRRRGFVDRWRDWLWGLV